MLLIGLKVRKKVQKKLNQIIIENDLPQIELVDFPRFIHFIKNESAKDMNRIASSIQKAFYSDNPEDVVKTVEQYNLHRVAQSGSPTWTFIQQHTLTKYQCEEGIVTITAFEGDSWSFDIKDQLGLTEEPKTLELVDFCKHMLVGLFEDDRSEENPLDMRIVQFSLSVLKDKYQLNYFDSEDYIVFVHKDQLVLVNKQNDERQIFEIKPLNSSIQLFLQKIFKLNRVSYILFSIFMINYFFLSIRFDTVPPTILFSNYQHEIMDLLLFESLVLKIGDDFDAEWNIQGRILNHEDILNPGKANVLLTISDSSMNERRIIHQIEVVDTTPPVLTLNNRINTIEYDNLSAFDYYSLITEITDNHEILPVEIDLPIQLQSVDIYQPLGNFSINITSRDVSGNVTRRIKQIEVVDTVAPVVTLSSRSTTIDLDDISNIDFLDYVSSVSDNYKDSEVEVTYRSNFNYPDIGTFTYRFTASDASGNSAVQTMSVEVVDTTPPVVETRNTLQLNVNDINGFDPSNILLSYSDNHKVSSIEFDPLSNLRNRIGSVPFAVTVTDPSGNVSKRTTMITIVDTTPPVITLNRSSLTLYDRVPTSTDYSSFVESVRDNYSSNPSLSIYIDNNGSSRPIPGLNNVVIAASDSSGNRTRRGVVIEIIDTIAPTITFINNDSRTLTLTQAQAAQSIYRQDVIRQNDNFLSLIAQLNDNISSSNFIDVSLTTPSSYDITRIGQVTFTFRATDEARNVRTYTYTIRTIANPS